MGVGLDVLSSVIDDCCCSIGLKLALSCVEASVELLDGRGGCVRRTGMGNADCGGGGCCCPIIFPLDKDSGCTDCLIVVRFDTGEGAG